MSTEQSITWSHGYTNSSPAENETFNMTRFIVLESTVSVFTVILCYLTIVFIIYDFRKPTRNRQMGSIRNPNAGSKNRYAITMRAGSIISASFLLGRFICEHYELVAQYTGAHAIDYCNIVVKLKVILSSISLTAAYVFLWTRQRFCYADPAMEHLTSNTTKVLSWFSLVLLFLAQVIGTILFTATRFYRLTGLGCFNDYSSIPEYIPWIWLGGATVIFQFLLFSLFVYPLWKHRSSLDSSRGQRSKDFLPIIRRAMITATLCIITDMLSLLLILLVVDSNEIIPTLAYDVSGVINVVCILMAFKDWKLRLLSPLPCCDLTAPNDRRKRLATHSTQKTSWMKHSKKRTNSVGVINSVSEESPHSYGAHINVALSNNNDSIL